MDHRYHEMRMSNQVVQVWRNKQTNKVTMRGKRLTKAVLARTQEVGIELGDLAEYSRTGSRVALIKAMRDKEPETSLRELLDRTKYVLGPWIDRFGVQRGSPYQP